MSAAWTPARNRLSTPSNAAVQLVGSVKEKRTHSPVGPPAGSGRRLSARTSTPRPARSPTTPAPTVPVAPVTATAGAISSALPGEFLVQADRAHRRPGVVDVVGEQDEV